MSTYVVVLVVAAGFIAEALALLPRFQNGRWFLRYVGLALVVFGTLNPLLQLDTVNGHEQAVRLVVAWIAASMLYVLCAKAFQWNSKRRAADPRHRGQ